MLDLVSASLSVCLVLWVVDVQEAALPLTVSLVHSRYSGWFDGRIKGEMPFAALGTAGNCAPAGNSANLCSFSSWLVGFLKPLAQQQLQPQDFGISLGYTFPKFADLTYRTHRQSLSGCPLFAVLTVGHFLVTVCRPLGVLISSSLSISSEVSFLLWEFFDLLSCFLGPAGGQWLAGV